MKMTEHVEHLLRQGRKPTELVELGFPKSVVTRVRRQLREEKGGVRQKGSQAKVNAPPNGGGGRMPQRGAAPIATVPSSSGVDDIESHPEIVQLKKEIRKAELEMALGRAKMPAEVAVLVAAAGELGKRRQKGCAFKESGVCMYWGWERKEEVPENLGEPVSIEEDGVRLWRIKPSPLYCAICVDPFETIVGEDIEEIESEVGADPLSGVKHKRVCEGCSSKGYVAAHIKCTKCGRETWLGWWPKE